MYDLAFLSQQYINNYNNQTKNWDEGKEINDNV